MLVPADWRVKRNRADEPRCVRYTRHEGIEIRAPGMARRKCRIRKRRGKFMRIIRDPREMQRLVEEYRSAVA